MSTQVVVFDTSVVDLTEKLSDPVEVLFGTQLGGGTDIGHALGYCQSLIRRPSDTVFILISDLIEGGVRETLIKRAASIIGSGVTLITLLALSDDGAPVFGSPHGPRVHRPAVHARRRAPLILTVRPRRGSR